jgi:hypothetical protein
MSSVYTPPFNRAADKLTSCQFVRNKKKLELYGPISTRNMQSNYLCKAGALTAIKYKDSLYIMASILLQLPSFIPIQNGICV